MNKVFRRKFDRSWLREARLLTGVSQKEAADAVGCSVTMFNFIENGLMTPNVKLGVRICVYFGCDPQHFVDEKAIQSQEGSVHHGSD